VIISKIGLSLLTNKFEEGGDNMPTEYTEDLYKGKNVTFEEFVMKCAEAFEELTMIDEDGAKEILDWHLRELENLNKRLSEIKSWNEEQAEQKAKKEYQEAIQDFRQNTYICKRYKEMLNQVQKWIPPTSDHEDLKQFMIEQLEKSIEMDCGHNLHEPKCLSGAEYKQEELRKTYDAIKYHRKSFKEIVKQIQRKRDWIYTLEESLHQHE